MEMTKIEDAICEVLGGISWAHSALTPPGNLKFLPTVEVSGKVNFEQSTVCLTSIRHPQIEGKFTATHDGRTNLLFMGAGIVPYNIIFRPTSFSFTILAF